MNQNYVNKARSSAVNENFIIEKSDILNKNTAIYEKTNSIGMVNKVNSQEPKVERTAGLENFNL